MAVEGVVGERETETDNSTDEEYSEDHFLLHLYFNGGTGQEVDSDADKSNAAEEMRPDVAGFSVDAED